MTQRITWQSLYEAYILLFIQYPLFLAYELCLWPFRLWYWFIFEVLVPLSMSIFKTFVVPLFHRFPLKHVKPWLPFSSIWSQSTKDKAAGNISYTQMQGYVLILPPDWDSSKEIVTFRPKDAVKILLQSSKSPKSKPKKQKAAKSSGPPSSRADLLSRHQLAYAVIDKSKGCMLKFYTDESCTQKHPHQRSVDIGACRIELCRNAAVGTRPFNRALPISLKLTSSTEIIMHLLAPTGVEKELWFFALRNICGQYQEVFDATSDYQSLLHHVIQSHSGGGNGKKKLQKQQDAITDLTASVSDVRWLNLVLARMWIHARQSQALHDWIFSRVLQRLSKIKRPSFLGELHIEELQIGNNVPIFDHARILTAEPTGYVEIELDVFYEGGFNIQIEAEARLEMASVSVKMLMAVNVKSIRGRILIRMNPLPSCRLWWAFVEEPIVDLAIEPMVAMTSVGFQVVKEAMEKKLMGIVRNTLVLPNMDDLVMPGCSTDDPCGLHSLKSSGNNNAVEDAKETQVKPTSPLSTPSRSRFSMSPMSPSSRIGTPNNWTSLFGPGLPAISVPSMNPFQGTLLPSLLGSLNSSTSPSIPVVIAEPESTHESKGKEIDERKPIVPSPLTPPSQRRRFNTRSATPNGNPFSDITDIE